MRKEVNNDCAVALGWKARGEERQRQTQNYLASHCREGERQTRMEHMDKSKTDSKQPPAVEERCPGLFASWRDEI